MKCGRAIVEGGRGTAARSLAILGAILQFAVRRKLIPANPAKGVRPFKGGKKERFLSEAEVADALAAMEREHRLNARAAAAVRLLLLTGVSQVGDPVAALGMGRLRTWLPKAPRQQNRGKGGASRRCGIGAAE
jgi:integrase